VLNCRGGLPRLGGLVPLGCAGPFVHRPDHGMEKATEAQHAALVEVFRRS
jgi:hypothetical protein